MIILGSNALESIKLKFAKYLVRDGFITAFQGVLLISYLFLIILIFCSNCSCSADKRIVIKSKSADNRDRWKALAPFVKNHFDTGNKTLEEISTDLYLAEYLMENTNND